jgi:hypothetical protein
MKEKIKDRWVEALRSGKYNQGTYQLHNVEHNKYCCLGVLCELAREDGIVALEKDKYFSVKEPNDNSILMLPKAVSKWAGISTCAVYSEKNRASLAMLNDAGQSFETIANVIEDEWRAF